MTSGKVSILTTETEFKGKLVFTGELHFSGRLEGQIESEGGKLLIGESAIIKADIQVAEVIVYGKLQGNINATGRVDLKSKAQVFGDMKCQSLSMEDGAVFVGRSEITAPQNISSPDFNQIFVRLKDSKS